MGLTFRKKEKRVLITKKKSLLFNDISFLITKVVDKKSKTVFLLALFLTVLVFSAPQTINVNASNNEKIPKTYNYVPFGGIGLEYYDFKINGSEIPINRTFLEIPSINYSITYEQQRKRFDRRGAEFPCELWNIVYQKDSNGDSYYYSGSLKLELGILGISDNELLDNVNVTSMPERAYVNITIYPMELKTYFVNEFYQFLNMFSTNNNTNVNENISYADLWSIWGPDSVPVFVLKNNSKFLPLIAPYEKTFYEELKEESLNIRYQLENNPAWKNNVETYYSYRGIGDPITTFDTNKSTTGFIYSNYIFTKLNASVFIETNNYNARIRLESVIHIDSDMSLGHLGIITNIYFYDKASNTEIEFNKQFYISQIEMSVESPSDGVVNASFDFNSFVVPLIIWIVPNIKNLKLIKKRLFTN